MKEGDRDREDRTVLEKMKRDREIAYLHSGKAGKIIIMDRSEYNDKMREAIIKMGADKYNKIREAIIKMDAERVTKNPNENLIEKRVALIKNGV